MTATAYNPQTFYAEQGQISDPGPYASELAQLPTELPGLVSAIQDLMVHLHWAERYGLVLNKARQAEANLRTTRGRIEKILELHPAPLTEARPLPQRTIGTCRDFVLLLASTLRLRGIPARARAGFGTYFTPGRFEDHWICEFWQADAARWGQVDAQLDSFQMKTLNVTFDPLDLPQTKFVTGAQAWQRCRARRVDPSRFGFLRMNGIDFVKGNLIRDFLTLNKIEILPWDNFGWIRKSFQKMTAAERELMDRFALVSSGEDRDFVLLRATFTAHQKDLLPDYFFST